ncbi:hypothetical protein D3C71_2070270 [compost metagenome]
MAVDLDQGSNHPEPAQLVAHPVFGDAAFNGGKGVTGQPLVDGRAPGRPGMHRFAIECVHQPRRSVLAYHNGEPGGVHR